jgi:8-oxo-dGTP diphosphatase
VTRPVPACPRCATAGEQPLTCERCGWRWYSNPKPAAAVLLERQAEGASEPSVLLLKRAVEPGFGEWDLPAGYLDAGESFEMAARRETREESGIEVELLSLSGVYHSPDANAVTVVFRGRALETDAPIVSDAEASDHAWVARSQVHAWIPRMAFPSMARALGDWAERGAGIPTE